MNRSIEFIEGIENDHQQKLMLMCYDLILSLLPNVRSIYKWNCPFFDYYGTYFCYINPFKDHMYLAFVNCQELDPPSQFTYEKKKVVLKVFLKTEEDVLHESLPKIIMEAALIHELKNKK